MKVRMYLSYCLQIFLSAFFSTALTAWAVELVVSPDPQSRVVDMTRYGLGQGGFSDQPMLAPHVADLKQLGS